jgi:amino acid adenylation domain-containing protein
MTELTAVDFDPFADGELSDAAPTTAAQREIWIASQLDEDASLAYNESITLVCRGPFDRAAMHAAIKELPARHEALRGTLSDDGKSLCIAASIDVPVVDVDAPASDPEAKLREVILKEAATPFNLSKGPLLRATIVRMADDDHRVVLGAHHIVCDGWSFAVLLKDLAPLYSAKKAKTDAKLPETHAFSTYAREEASRDSSKESAYWLSRCEPVPEPLELPTDYARPALRSVAADRVDLRLDPQLVQAVKKTGAKSGASFFVTLFAAFGVLMSRLSGQKDVFVGIPASGQSALGREMLVGHCANLLPIRVGVNLETPFSGMIKEMRKTVLDAYEHQRFTLGDVLPKLKVPRQANRLPLVSILFNLDTGMAPGGLPFDGLDVSFRANARIAETFEIFLNCFETEGTVVLESQFSTTLWSRETMTAWLGAYEAILKAFVAAPDTLCGKLPVLAESDARKMVGEWNNTKKSYPETATMFDVLVETAKRIPDKAAVVDDEQTLTYAQLVTRSRSVAEALKRKGIGANDLVAVVVDRSALMLPLLLGVMASGAAYIPVDPEYPPERVATWISKAKLCIVSPRTENAASATSCPSVQMEELFKAPGDGTMAAPGGDGRAYVLFTSGSTGVPKGVEVTHKNLVNFVMSMKADPGMSEKDVLGAVVTLSFDISGYEMYVPLAAGATIVVADRETAQDGRDLAELLQKHAVTVVQATPSTFRLLKLAGYDPKGLKALVGGEAFPPDIAEWLITGGADVTNVYGPTETTIWSTLQHVTEVTNPIPIGKPIANTTTYVLDAAGEMTAIGAIGELLIGGDGVAKGYLDQPEATAERFIKDRFSDKPGARLYRTGDRARIRHDGAIEYLGRGDNQVKIRGHRIEIGEIEAAMHKFDPVSQGAVCVLKDGNDARLAAFIIPKAGQTVTATELRRHLRKTLPDAMIPQIVELVTDLPQTSNGKLDRGALAKLGSKENRREREIVPPTTEHEKLLAEMFQRVLKLDKISTHDNFFNLGGDSLTSMEVVIEIEKKTGVRIAPRALLLSSLADAAKTVEEGKRR